MYINSKLTNHFTYPTRTWVHIKNGNYDSNLRIGPEKKADHLLSQRSFRWRASNQWNKLPIEVKQSVTLNEFKILIKKWIRTNIPVKATNE